MDDLNRQVKMMILYREHLSNILERKVSAEEAAQLWSAHVAAMYRVRHPFPEALNNKSEGD